MRILHRSRQPATWEGIPTGVARFACALATILSVTYTARAQVFPAINIKADSSNSPWSFSIEPWFGLAGSIPDSGSDPVAALLGLDSNAWILPESPVPAFGVSVGLHYRFAAGTTISVVGGYQRRGATSTSSDSLGEYVRQAFVDYVAVEPKFSFGYEKLTLGVGLNFGLPIRARVGDRRGTPKMPRDLTDGEDYRLPDMIALQIDCLFPLLKFSRQVVSLGLTLDFVFTDLITGTLVTVDGITTSTRLAVNYSFE